LFHTVSDGQNSGDSVVKKAAPRKRASRAKNVKTAVGKAAVATAKVTTDVEMAVDLTSDEDEGIADEVIANSTGEVTDIPIDQNEKLDEKLDTGISVTSPVEEAITSSSVEVKSIDVEMTVNLTTADDAVTLATSLEASTVATTALTAAATTDTPTLPVAAIFPTSAVDITDLTTATAIDAPTVPVAAVLPITGVKRSRVVAAKVAYIMYIIHEISTSGVNYVRRILPYIYSINIHMHIYSSGGSCDDEGERSRLVT
jgi:hypothetical protein